MFLLAVALALARKTMAAAYGLGLVLAVYSWAYIAAVRYIPVSLAVLLLYTFPAQVVVMTVLLGERLTPTRLAGIAMVVLALGPLQMEGWRRPARPAGEDR